MNGKAFRSLLLADANVAQMSASRIYPLALPENPQKPAIVYVFAGGSGDRTFDGVGPRTVRVQIDCYADRYMEADALRDAIVFALDDAGGAQSDGSDLMLAEYIQPLDHFDSDPRDYRVGVEYRLHYNPPALAGTTEESD